MGLSYFKITKLIRSITIARGCSRRTVVEGYDATGELIFTKYGTEANRTFGRLKSQGIMAVERRRFGV